MYYKLRDNDNGYKDSGNICSYPELPPRVSFNMGRYIDQPLNEPLRFKMYPDWGSQPMLLWGSEITLMHKDLVATLQAAGVDNLQTFPAVLENPYTNEDLLDYLAINILGLVAAADLEKSDITAFSNPPRIDSITFSPKIDPAKANGALMFRMAESVMRIMVHEKIKIALEEKFPTLYFIEA